MSSRSPDLDVAALLADPHVRWSTDVLRFCDTDANGHVNNAAFAVFCESGRVAFLNDRLGAVVERGGFFVIARLIIEFRAELHYPGEVRCGTWLSGIGRTSAVFAQAILGPTGALVATSEAVTVMMDGATRRPMPLDDGMRTSVAPYLRNDLKAVG